MKTKSKKDKNGSALVLTMVVLVALSGAVAVTYSVTNNNVVATVRSRNVDTLETAAEGVLDYAYGIWKAEMQDVAEPLSTEAAQAIVTSGPSLPNGITYVNNPAVTISAVDEVGEPVGDATAIPTVSTEPPGWTAQRYSYVASVTLEKNVPGGQPARVTMRRYFHNERIWPFSGLFFVEGDFELYKPAPMIVEGPVHTNARGYVTDDTNDLVFGTSSSVSFVNGYTHTDAPYATNWSTYDPAKDIAPIYSLGYENQVSSTNELEGIGNGTSLEFDTTDSNPNNNGNRELIEPPVAGHTDPDQIAASRIYNNAGLIVEIQGPLNPSAGVTAAGGGAFTGENITIKAQNGTGLNQSQATAILNSLANSSVQKVEVWQENLVWVESQVWVENLVWVESQVWVENWVQEQVWVTSGYYKGKGKKRRWVDTSHWETQSVDRGYYETQGEWEDQGHYATQGEWEDHGQMVEVDQYVQNTVYDKRESSHVKITDLDIGSVKGTINALSNFNNILYIHDTGSPGERTAIRLTNGGVLPSDGLTVASQNGVYVVGDYNVNTTDPDDVPSNDGGNPNNTDKSYYGNTPPPAAAIAADAVMFLSNNWDDDNASDDIDSRNADHTTVNSAIIAGFVPSGEGANHEWYSGGMNNFPRFLEKWTGDYMTYFGAFVQLYESELFVGRWDTSNIYRPPNRRWNFDTLLLSRVIPGIPPASAYSKGRVTKS